MYTAMAGSGRFMLDTEISELHAATVSGGIVTTASWRYEINTLRHAQGLRAVLLMLVSSCGLYGLNSIRLNTCSSSVFMMLREKVKALELWRIVFLGAPPLP